MSVTKTSGFSLPELTVGLGLVAGISLVTVKMVENNANNQASLKASGEIQKAMALVKAAINDPQNCGYTLGGKSIGSYATPTMVTGSLNQRIKNHSTNTFTYKELITPNSSYIGFRTGDIYLRYPSSGVTNMAELVVNFKLEKKAGLLDDKNSSNDKSYPHVIPIIVKQTSNVISDCGPAVSDVTEEAKHKFCLSLGSMALWDSVGRKCSFKEFKCPSGKVPSKVASTGDLTCVDVTKQVDPTQIFNTGAGTACQVKSSNSFTIQESNGKLVIICK